MEVCGFQCVWYEADFECFFFKLRDGKANSIYGDGTFEC